MALPPPSPNQKHVSIFPLAAGHITLPEWAFVTPADPTVRKTVPSMAFFITHPSATLSLPNQPSPSPPKPFSLMFDLGLRSRPEAYIAQLQEHITSRQPVHHRPSAKETLQSGGVKADDVDAVMISHVHWDHHGDPEDFKQATFILGNGAVGVLEHGMPGRGAHSHFDPALLKGVREVVELPGEKDDIWKPLGPFPATLDLFGDGSVYVVSAPGHLPGHINLLCRTGKKKWAYLGGDAFHDRRILTGEKGIATWLDPKGSGSMFCIHIDKDAAAVTIERIRELLKATKEEDYEVEVVVAHDVGWYEENQQRFFPNVM